MFAVGSTGGIATAHEDHQGGPPEPFVVTCEGVQHTVVVADGHWAAAIDRDSRTVFIPKSFTFTIIGTDVNGDEFLNESERVDQGKGNAHKNQPTVTCTFGDTFTDEDSNSFTFTGAATVVRRP